MQHLSLPPAARQQLAEQATQNGTFIHGLRDPSGLICCLAFVTVEQCTAAVCARVEMGDSVNSITLARRADTGARVARFLEELANGVSPSRVPEVEEYLLVDDMEEMLRDAIRTGQGGYYLPADEIDLCLELRPAIGSAQRGDARRTVFRFEINEAAVTLPMLLPSDRQLAYELLAACAKELIANYRSSAA